ncbi:hypothetical protein [Sphingomonas sp. CV7422]|uniref:hypothetical protein n=1 Tax=Sphingomonas sp. CV7422 TaxID=3018036 RepID=UPI0022FE1D62|nr:hypothetical protein [Sphingomonas sp. CV7422]
MGVQLADLVRVYLERVDDRSYVACTELVEDTRLVSLRADQLKVASAIEGVLRRHGYAFTSSGGITYVCPIAAPAPTAQAYDPTAPGPLSGSSDVSQPAAVQPPIREVHAVFSRPQGNYVDVLAAQGFQYAGCIETDKGTRVAMKGQGRTYTFDLSLVRKSGISPIVQCRI